MAIWLTICLWGLPILGWCADKVKLRNGITVTGEILHYDDRGLTIQSNTGQVFDYAPDQIADVETVYPRSWDRAIQAFAAQQYETAAQAFTQVLREDDRGWIQSSVRPKLLQCWIFSENWQSAGQLFAELLPSRPDMEFMDLAPLLWQATVVMDQDALLQAEHWLDTSQPAELRLLGASWLLLSDNPAWRRQADQTLGLLQRPINGQEPKERVFWLARAQQWRLWLRARDPVSATALTQMALELPRFPVKLRAGGQFVYGSLLWQQRDYPNAALALLKIPYIYQPENSGQTLRWEALLLAAQATQAAGWPAEARKLFGEIVQKVPNSRWGKAAQQELQLNSQ